MAERQDEARPDASDQPTRATGPERAGESPPIPKAIGGYEVRHQIDAGGMGIVYEAVQQEPRRTVALKVMRRGLSSKSAQRRFEYESQLLARLNHPGIAVVYEAGTHREHGEEFPFFAMEYIAGARHLTDYASALDLAPDHRLRLMADVCEAVHHAHLRGIIHRDLKPANILVSSSGAAKVIDFGVARALDSDLAPATQQTDIGQLVGTLQYMSPEQVDGDPHDIDARSDVYALGLILYELLIGVLPYNVSTMTPRAAAAVITDRHRPAPKEAVKRLHGDLRTVVLKAIERERDHRYASADALARDLRHVLAGEPVEARRPTTAYILISAARRQITTHPWLSLLAIAIVSTSIANWVLSPLAFRWLPFIAAGYERMAAMVVPRPTNVAGLENLRIIAMEDGTDFDSLAARAGVPGVSSADLYSLRRLHGELMQRLASSGARAVAWDIFFEDAAEHDAPFRAGLDALRASGINTVLGVKRWSTRPDGSPWIAPEFASAPGVLWGASTCTIDPQCSLDVAAYAGPSAVTPSFAILSACAARRSIDAFTVDVDRNLDRVIARRWIRHPTILDARTPDGDAEVWRVTSVQTTENKPQDIKVGLAPGSFLALCTIPVPDVDAFRPVTLTYADVFSMTPEQLRRWAAGRVVLIGDARRLRTDPDYSTLPDGRLMWGCHLQAAGIAALLDGQYVRVPDQYASLALTGTAALVGLVGAGAARHRRAVFVVCMLMGMSGAVILSLGIYRQWLYLCNPTIPLLAMALAGGGASAILSLRRIRSP